MICVLLLLQTVESTLPVVGVGGRGTGGRNLSNIREDDEKREYFDNPEELDKKLDKVVEWMKESKHVIFFTGAGISTRFVLTERYVVHTLSHTHTYLYILTHTHTFIQLWNS